MIVELKFLYENGILKHSILFTSIEEANKYGVDRVIEFSINPHPIYKSPCGFEVSEKQVFTNIKEAIEHE